MTGDAARPTDVLVAFVAAALFLLLFPDGGAWLSEAPLEAELEEPAAAGLAGRSAGLLRLLPEARSWTRAVVALGLALSAALAGAAAAGLTGVRWAAVAATFTFALHPATLAGRLDPLAAVDAARLVVLAGGVLGLVEAGTAGRVLALAIFNAGWFLGTGVGLLGNGIWLSAAAGRGGGRRRVLLAAGVALAAAGVLLWTRDTLPGGEAFAAALLPAGAFRAGDPRPVIATAGSWLPLVLLLLAALRGSGPREVVPALGLAGAAAAAVLLAPADAPGAVHAAAGRLVPAAGLLAVAVAALAAAPVARAAARTGRPSWPDVALAAGALILFWVAGLGSASRTRLVQEPHRAEAARLIAAVRDLPPLEGGFVDVLLLPRVRRPAYGPALHRAFQGRPVLAEAALVDPGPGSFLRVVEWLPVPPSAARDPASHALAVRFLAVRPVSPEVELAAPADGARLPCRTAADEPAFVVTVPLERDPGAGALKFVALREPHNALAGPTLLTRRLDPGVCDRRVTGDRVRYSWRPSIRSRTLGEPELLWERGEIAPPGTTFTWTIAVAVADRDFLMAPPRAVRVLP